MNKTLKEIAQIIDGELFGEENLIIKGINDIEKAQEYEITVLKDEKYIEFAKNTKASCIILPKKIEGIKTSYIIVKDPEIAFVKLLRTIFQEKQNFYKGIHPTVVKFDNVNLGTDISIGPYCILGNNVCIGDNSVLTANIFIGNNVKIGKNVIIYPNVIILEDTWIGNNVIIHSGSIIGSDGFGYIKRDSENIKVPQIGRVIIEDDVEIGANVCIDRATISETRVSKGAKIDNLVHIAHNVFIGKNVMLLAQVGIAGSSKVGDNTILAGQTGVADHINISHDVIAAPRTGIIKDVPNNQIIWGFPAIPFNEQKKIFILYRKLPKLFSEVNTIKKKLEKLENMLDDIISKIKLL